MTLHRAPSLADIHSAGSGMLTIRQLPSTQCYAQMNVVKSDHDPTISREKKCSTAVEVTPCCILEKIFTVEGADSLDVHTWFRHLHEAGFWSQSLQRCRATSVAALKAVVAKVQQQQEGDAIQPWSEIASTASVIPEDEMPLPGEILPDIKEYPYLGAKELTLANGMKVSLYCQ